MCILGLSLNLNNKYPFILIDNRDENPNRIAEETISLDKDTGILCARDLQGGGTWCGYNTKTGAFAVLTNVDDDPYQPSQGIRHHSRGAIVNDLLRAPSQNKQEFYNQFLRDEKWLSGYRGFNIVCGNMKSVCCEPRDETHVYCMTNRSFVKEKHWPNVSGPFVEELQRGTFCVSNSFLNDESWTKVAHLKQQMEKVMERVNSEDLGLIQIRDLFGSLLNIRCLDPKYEETVLPPHCTQVENMTQFQLDNEMIDVHSFNNIFVNYRGKELSWVTRAQTIIIGESNGTAHYFYRNCDGVSHDPSSTDAQWDHCTFAPAY